MNQDSLIKVLLLEDDPEDQQLLIKQLQKEPYQYRITATDTLAAAVDQLLKQTFDVVLTDLAVPDSFGLRTVSSLKKHCGQAPIIILTTLEDDRVDNKFLASGAQDYLIKGDFSSHTVSRAIRHAVQRQQSLNEVHGLVQDLKLSQEQLREQSQMLQEKNLRLEKLYNTAQEFVDNVSHDFRTPLTVIKDYATIIREGMVGEVNVEQQAMLDKVSVRVDDLNIMVDDLLDISKLESGLLGAWRRNSRVEDIVARTESLLQQRAQVKNVSLEIELDGKLPLVYCDADKVGRVITNLAVNAIKFAGNEGQVRLWAEADLAGRQVVVGVTDNGPGIDAESLEQIFQRFQQLKQVKSTEKGFGLGLNIARQLIALNLGELNVQSQPGKGSTFSFTLPFAQPIEVVRRWWTAKAECAEAMQVVEITLADDANSDDADEFDKFLNCLLRHDDLLFRISSRTWLLVMRVHRVEAHMWFERAEKEFTRTNRNRPLGPLPNYRAETRRQWNPHDSEECVLEGLENILLQTQKSKTIEAISREEFV